MHSVPAHIPAISVVTFGAGLADPDLIRGTASSNTADSGANPLRNLHRKCLSEPYRLIPQEHQSSQFRRHFTHSGTGQHHGRSTDPG
jgi:hypothetical protein